MSGSFVPKPEWLAYDWHRACIDADGLCIQRCTSCGTWRHPPRRFCAQCASRESAFERVAGTGTVISLAVSYRSLDPGWAEHVPFATLVVELDEGPRVLAATRSAPADAGIGTQVRCTTEARSDSFVLLWAEPVGAAVGDERTSAAPV